jgi:hypothetical protein
MAMWPSCVQVDRLILELKLPPTDAYYKLKHTVEARHGVLFPCGLSPCADMMWETDPLSCRPPLGMRDACMRQQQVMGSVQQSG